MRRYRRNERTILGIAGVASFVLIWQVGAMTGLIDPFFFSSPGAVVLAGVEEVQLPRFWNDAKVSSIELAIGAFAAFALAVPLGIVIGWWRRVSYTFDPWLNFFNALPRIALIPLVVLWAGLGVEMKIVIVFLGGFFSMIVPTVQGVRTVDRALLDVAQSFKASTVRTFTSL
ncbi:MAG: NitT/TauT family transport system permease protein, partial [Chloroflexota bacterium]|nr:NitT/TauT family transport system permease protein [Chloroflexota bacterium]